MNFRWLLTNFTCIWKNYGASLTFDLLHRRNLVILLVVIRIEKADYLR